MYFTVESQSSDKEKILALVLSMHICMKGSNLTIGCTKKTFDYVTSFYKVDINLKHIEIADEDANPMNLFVNFRNVISDVHLENDKAVYIAPIVYVINDLSKVVDDTSNKGIVVIKRDCELVEEAGNYPLIFAVFNKDNITMEAIDKYIEDNMDLCVNTKNKLLEIGYPTDSMDSEECKKIRNMRSELYVPISAMAQNFILVMLKQNDLVSLITDGIFMDMFNFYAMEKPWQLKDIAGNDDAKICRNNTPIYLVAPAPDPRRIPNNIIQHAITLCQNIDNITNINDRRYLFIQNLHFILAVNRIVIFGPKKDLLGDWKRDNVPSFDTYMVQLVAKSKYLNYKRDVSDDYYSVGHVGLYDYPNNSLIRGDILQGQLKVMTLFNYNNKVLDELKDNYIYVGLYTPYILMLEHYIIENEKEKDTYYFTDTEVYSSEKNYIEYLNELSMYKYSFITDDTCKCHIVDCLRLGVVPVIDENCRVLEIEDVVSGEEEWKEKSKKCMDYFSQNLTAENVSLRFCKALFDFIPPGPKRVFKSD